jgi:hypothetical protein
MLRSEHLVAGQRLPRLDGAAKVSGRHIYAADFSLFCEAAYRARGSSVSTRAA